MPGYDGTGPRGMGAMTGGGRGFCSPTGAGRTFGVRRWLAPRFGRGGFASGAYDRGRGFGLGRFTYGGFPEPTYGPAAGYGEPMSAAEEQNELRQELSTIEAHLAKIREQLQATDE